MLRVAGVKPVVGVTESHAPPCVVVAEAENVVGVEEDSATLCAAGAAPPMFCANVNELIETVSAAFVPTVMTTLIACGLLATEAGAVAVSVRVAVNVPAARLDGFADNERFEGVTPVEVFTNSQPAAPLE